MEAVDSSAPALATARANAEANGIANIEFREADVFDLLAGYASGAPPIFAGGARSAGLRQSRAATWSAAIAGYKEINLRALRLLPPGGILVTCSCSHHVSEAHVLELVAEASLDANRTLRVLERRTQSQDHPILLTVPGDALFEVPDPGSGVKEAQPRMLRLVISRPFPLPA